MQQLQHSEARNDYFDASDLIKPESMDIYKNVSISTKNRFSCHIDSQSVVILPQTR